MKVCTRCKQLKDISCFHKSKNTLTGHTYYCKECANEKSRLLHHKRKDSLDYKESKRNAYYKTKYGLTLKESIEKLKAQNYKCAICKVELPTGGHLTHLDHNHTTGRIRAFLCTNCNRGLGHFQDSVENLQEAIKYLKSHSSNVD